MSEGRTFTESQLKILDDRSNPQFDSLMAKALITESSDVRDNIVVVGRPIMAGKGFSTVGLNEILAPAGVPIGSFHHCFGLKDAVGEAFLVKYFENTWPIWTSR